MRRRAGRNALAVVRGPLVITGPDGRRRSVPHNVAQAAAYQAVDRTTARAEAARYRFGGAMP